MDVREPAQRAEDAGTQWAAQFTVDGGEESLQESLRNIAGSAYSAGWIVGYREALKDAGAVLQGVQS